MVTDTATAASLADGDAETPRQKGRTDMLRRLVLVRPGTAHLRFPCGTDAERKLTNEGASLLNRWYPRWFGTLASPDEPVTIWASFTVRARQTAEIICDALNLPPDFVQLSQPLTALDWERSLRKLKLQDGIAVAVGSGLVVDKMASVETGAPRTLSPGEALCLDMSDGRPYRHTVLWDVCPH